MSSWKLQEPDEAFGVPVTPCISFLSFQCTNLFLRIISQVPPASWIDFEWAQMSSSLPLTVRTQFSDSGCGRCNLYKLLVPIFSRKENFVKVHGKWDEANTHGFSKGKPRLTNFIAFYDRVAVLVDERKTYFIHLDLFKAFYTVVINSLVSKFGRYGFGGWTSCYIRNWLDGGTQRMAVNCLHVPMENMKGGVPQGLTVGPVLFITEFLILF